MFDLDTLYGMNERASRQAVVERKDPADKPLLQLADKLRSRRPPSIRTLLSLIEDNRNYGEFIKLLDEFLPERKQEILKLTGPQEQIVKFASYFEDRYFPLPWNFKEDDDQSYYDLVHSLPLIPLGFGYQDYDNLVADGYPGFQLMTFFFRQPYDDTGARVALGEACSDHMPIELLKRLPDNGFTTEEMHRLLDGTHYKALAMWGDVIYSSTGNTLLDTDEEMMGNSVLPDWTKENVEYFTREWQKAERYQQETDALSDKFEKQPAIFFKKVMDFIDKRKEELDGRKTDHESNSIPVGTPGKS